MKRGCPNCKGVNLGRRLICRVTVNSDGPSTNLPDPWTYGECGWLGYILEEVKE